LPRPVIDQYIQHADSSDKDGWHYLLPAFPSSHSVICVDARFGATAAAFAERSASVTVVHPCPVTVQIIRHRLAASNVPNVVVVQIRPEDDTLPFEDASFDVFVHHDVAGTLTTNPFAAASPFATLTPIVARQAYRLLRQHGIAYFGVPNPYGYHRWQTRMTRSSTQGASTPLPPALWRAKRSIRHAGFPPPTAFPYLIEHGHVSEIISPAGYRSVKNSLRPNETIKELLLGKFGARLLAPAYGLISVKGRSHETQLQVLVDDLATHNDCATRPGFRRYVCLPGKVFVTLERAGSAANNIIMVIPKTPTVRERRRQEIAIVTELRALSPFLAAKLPQLYLEASSRGEVYFALTEIRGITIDREVPYLDRLTSKAVDFLIRFNRLTALASTITTDVYTDSIGSITAHVAATYPDIRARIEQIDHYLRNTLINRTLRKVWLHGDYKLENLIFEPNTLDIAGVIDWEHSRRASLPWIDLLYLLAYNRIMVEKRDFFAVYREVVLAEAYTSHERSLIDTYAEALPVDMPMKVALAALFFLHHIGYRYRYDMRMPEDVQNVVSTLHELETRLSQIHQTT
jgi:SAM-dependent methyltransferase